MTHSEKAKELFEEFRAASRHKYIERTGQDADEMGKILALICVEQIIQAFEVVIAPESITAGTKEDQELMGGMEFWQEVKKHLESI